MILRKSWKICLSCTFYNNLQIITFLMEPQSITKYLKLPFQFDQEKLVEELHTLLKSEWVPHFNTNGYDGNWNSIALYALDGNPKNIHAFSNSNAPIKETPILQHCAYFKTVIASFKCPLLSVRLLRLSPGSFIKPHRDLNLGYENNCFRLHIPILTNPKVTFTLDNQILEMQPGECWYTNVNYTHSVSNKGNSERIHLVLDGQRNDWSDDLFFSLVPKESLITISQQNYDPATIRSMIGELENIQTPGAKQLMQELRDRLDRT